MITLFSRSHLLLLFLLFAGGTAGATTQTGTPHDDSSALLPDLGIAADSQDNARHFAEEVKAFGEASMKNNGLSTGEQARLFALDKISSELNTRVNQQLDYWLSPWGNASAKLMLDSNGTFSGSRGSWFIPLADNNRHLTWSQLALNSTDEGLVSNLGLGQRWVAGNWLLGYNTFYDSLLRGNLHRGGAGAEAWGEYLRLSANYYHPFGHWHNATDTQQRRLARGYDLTARMRLPFYRYINTSLSFEQYFGNSVDLFRSGTGYHNPVAVSLGLSYTPVPLVTLSAWHKQGESGASQNNLGMELNYRFGVPLKKQLAPDEVAAFTSLRGSRYDSPERSDIPAMEYRQRKTLSVFLATPPWDLHPGETVQLKLQIHSRFTVKSLIWQGDSQVLSLTPPVNRTDPDGWSVIMPAWDSSEGATNRWRLSVIVEDEKGQRVSSNAITLALAEPLVSLLAASAESVWQP